jgi:hypothetical protein
MDGKRGTGKIISPPMPSAPTNDHSMSLRFDCDEDK